MTHPLIAARNLAAKAWRRGRPSPRRSAHVARRARVQRAVDDVPVTSGASSANLPFWRAGVGPIIAGPWLSEVGFEVLYWIPFLRWFEDRYRVDRERVIAVSRGGASSWYADVAGAYVEIFDHLDPETFARRNAERRDVDESGGQKQTTHGPLDDEILQAVRRSIGGDNAPVCHPQLMYRLFNQFWSGNRPLDLVTSHTRHRLLRMSRPADVGAARSIRGGEVLYRDGAAGIGRAPARAS